MLNILALYLLIGAVEMLIFRLALWGKHNRMFVPHFSQFILYTAIGIVAWPLSDMCIIVGLLLMYAGGDRHPIATLRERIREISRETA